MSKNRKKRFNKGVKRNSLRPLLIQVFERNQGTELTHKEICQIIDARDPNARQNVFDELNLLVKHGSIQRVNHFTFKDLQDSAYLECKIDITQRGAGFVSCEGHEREDVLRSPGL